MLSRALRIWQDRARSPKKTNQKTDEIDYVAKGFLFLGVVAQQPAEGWPSRRWLANSA